MNYKEQDSQFISNRIKNEESENETIELKIIRILLKLNACLKSEDQNIASKNDDKIVYYLNSIRDMNPEEIDMCNHPCFISNSIFLNILSLFTPDTPFIIITSASLAISTFSYLFSMYPDSNCQFNISDLFLILQPETLFLIFDFIRKGINENISSITKMLRNYCIASKQFRDDLISTFPIDKMSELIAYGTENNCDIDWVENLVSLICDICFHPISEQHAESVISIFNAFDFSSTSINIIYQIFHTIRYLIEKNSNESETETTETSTIQKESLSDNSWNPALLIMKWKYYDQLDLFLNKMNETKINIHNLSYKVYFETLLSRIKDDICSISISIYSLTKNELLILPISKFIDFMKYDEKEEGETTVKQNIVYNSLYFFSNYMNEKEENFEECNKLEFFNNLGPAIKGLSAKIRIQAGHVLFTLISKADSNLLTNLLLQGFFVWAFKLIQLDDTRLSIEMLIVMQTFIQFVINSNNIRLAEIIKDNYIDRDYNMEDTLNDLYLNNENDTPNELETELSSFAYQTIEMINECFVYFNFKEEEKEEEDENDNTHLFNFVQNDDENTDYYDDDAININFEAADQLFFGTKPNPWI